MDILSKLFNYIPKNEREGISLSTKECWEVFSIKDFPAFLKVISNLVPTGSILYLEGSDTPKKLRSYLEERASQNICKVEMGTIWPRPDVFHIDITKENMAGLAELAENCCTPEVAVHLHVYKEGKILLQWYDAFYDPLFISKDIPEENIKKFCNSLNVKYKFVQ